MLTDELKTFCKNMGLKLVYTDNKYTVLSTGRHKNIPTLRVHRLFKNSPKRVIRAIISYYTNLQNPNQYLDIIKQYLNKHHDSKKFKIKSQSDFFRNYMKNRIIESTGGKNQQQEHLVEMPINSLIKKDFGGKASKIDPEDSLKASSDNVLELEIVVEDPADT